MCTVIVTTQVGSNPRNVSNPLPTKPQYICIYNQHDTHHPLLPMLTACLQMCTLWMFKPPSAFFQRNGIFSVFEGDSKTWEQDMRWDGRERSGYEWGHKTFTHDPFSHALLHAFALPQAPRARTSQIYSTDLSC